MTIRNFALLSVTVLMACHSAWAQATNCRQVGGCS